MLVYFWKKSRSIKIERLKKDAKLWEEIDGYHFLASDSILKDETNIYPPKIIFYDDVVSPLGTVEANEKINQLFDWFNLIKNNSGTISISNLNARRFAEFLKYFPYIFVFGLIAIGLYTGSA